MLRHAVLVNYPMMLLQICSSLLVPFEDDGLAGPWLSILTQNISLGRKTESRSEESGVLLISYPPNRV